MFIGGAVTRVSPSTVLPGVLVQYAQASGAFETLAGGDPMVRLSEGDLFVYMAKLDVRTKVGAGQAAYNLIPSCTIVATQAMTPTYLVRTRAEYDHHDIAHASRWGVALPEASRLAMRQGIFQQLRNALLYGFNPALGEGLVNSQSATTINLPPDSNTHQTVVTYDNGQMAVFLLTQIMQAKTRCMQLGQPTRIVILGPQRVLGAMEYQNIVLLASFQAAGGGSTSTAGMLKAIAEKAGDTIEWVYDDTLIGKGAGGNDAVLVVIPEIKRPARGRPATNEFAQLMPGIDACTLQLADMAAPREIPTPLPGGAIDVLSEMRITSGWALRPEAVTLISMQYQ